MTPHQFYGWSRDHDFLHESKTPRRETWLAKKLRGEEATPKLEEGVMRTKNSMECIDGHYWVENSGMGGEPKFEIKTPFHPEPVMHVRCKECGARTFFTEKQWLKEWGI